MKKLICALVICASTPVFACSFKAWDDSNVNAFVKEKGGYPLGDKECAMLNENGMSLWVDAHSAVLNGINVGSATVAVWKDGVVSDASGQSTQVNSGGVGSQNIANDRMFDAIRAAIKSLNFEKAINEVHTYTAKAKQKALKN